MVFSLLRPARFAQVTAPVTTWQSKTARLSSTDRPGGFWFRDKLPKRRCSMNQRTKALDRVSEIFHFKLHRILSQTTSGIFHFPVPELDEVIPLAKRGTHWTTNMFLPNLKDSASWSLIHSLTFSEQSGLWIWICQDEGYIPGGCELCNWSRATISKSDLWSTRKVLSAAIHVPLAEPRRCSLDETRSREELCNKTFTKSIIGSIINFRRRVTP